MLEGPADARAHSSSRRGINVESRQQVLKDMWPGEKAVPPAGYTTSSKIQLHNIYSPIPSVSGVCSCKEGRINLFPYDCLHGAPSSSLAAALSRPRRERTALCANFLCQRPKLVLMWTLLGAQPCDQSSESNPPLWLGAFPGQFGDLGVEEPSTVVPASGALTRLWWALSDVLSRQGPAFMDRMSFPSVSCLYMSPEGPNSISGAITNGLKRQSQDLCPKTQTHHQGIVRVISMPVAKFSVATLKTWAAECVGSAQ